MANPWAGEVAITVDGVERPMRLTLGALAELEAGLGEESLVALIGRFEEGRFSARDVLALLVAGRFEEGRFSARDVLALLVAGLRGGGWEGCSAAALAGAGIAGGPLGAARAAAELLARSFALPEAR